MTDAAADIAPERASAPTQSGVARTLRRARVLRRVDRDARAAEVEAERSLEDLRVEAEAAGLRAGREAAEREAAETLHRLALETRAWRERVQDQLVEAVMRAVERVLGEIDDVALARRVAAAALAEIRGVGALSLHVAPAAAEALRADLAELTAPYPGLSIVEVTPDATVRPGGAVLRGPAGVVDARIETQLAALRASLDAAFERAAAAEDDR